MGADFVFAISKHVKDPAKLIRKIDLLSEEDLEALADEQLGSDPTDHQYVRDFLTDAVWVAADSPPRRDTGLLNLKDEAYVLSGGMTWGDNPTDACLYLWVLEASGIEEE